jgi:hypothetical protein
LTRKNFNNVENNEFGIALKKFKLSDEEELVNIMNEIRIFQCLSSSKPFYNKYFGCFYIENEKKEVEIGITMEYIETDLITELNNRLNRFVRVKEIFNFRNTRIIWMGMKQ